MTTDHHKQLRKRISSSCLQMPFPIPFPWLITHDSLMGLALRINNWRNHRTSEGIEFPARCRWRSEQISLGPKVTCFFQDCLHFAAPTKLGMDQIKGQEIHLISMHEPRCPQEMSSMSSAELKEDWLVILLLSPSCGFWVLPKAINNRPQLGLGQEEWPT